MRIRMIATCAALAAVVACAPDQQHPDVADTATTPADFVAPPDAATSQTPALPAPQQGQPQPTTSGRPAPVSRDTAARSGTRQNGTRQPDSIIGWDSVILIPPKGIPRP